ncbi:GNAT family N-acetyltransferase [Haloarchaeobius sp. HME9146]|uniref:GNAT family N-acetyltransferase n=1 Tax=Haloarchaeobius sp. HME9146 TaxID=2978732 RepID=UPI0021C2381A|nr:GNAT family N-acetyltransferase [Haloarchaeobius sp. HME9146]
MFPETISTDRLRFERLCHETVDAIEYHQVCSHHEPGIDEVTRYLPWDTHQTVAETAEYLDSLESQWQDRTRAEYLIRPKPGEDGAGDIAGSGGLIVDWETRTGKPAIWLRKRFWGRGYSAERALAMLALAFDRLDLDLVAIPVQDRNDRSRRAVETYVERFGGQYDGRIRNSTVRPGGAVVDHHRYTVTKAQYRERVGESSVTFGP